MSVVLFLRSSVCLDYQLRLSHLILNNEKIFFPLQIDWGAAISRASAWGSRSLIEYSGCWRLMASCLRLKLLEMLCPARRLGKGRGKQTDEYILQLPSNVMQTDEHLSLRPA